MDTPYGLCPSINSYAQMKTESENNIDEELHPFGSPDIGTLNTRRDWIAYTAMVLSGLAFFPSFYVIIRNKSACNISITSLVLRSLASCLWLYFALANEIRPSIVGSAIGLALVLSFLALVMAFQQNCK